MFCEVLYNILSFCFWLDEILTIFYSEITRPNDLLGGTNHVCSPQNENIKYNGPNQFLEFIM